MTLVGVEPGVGRPRLRLVAGNLAPRLITSDAHGARVALVATSALLLGGDGVELELLVGPGAWLEIVETAGTVAYDAGGQPSTWTVHATVATGGLLLWHGEPLVVSHGANVLRRTTVELGERSVVCLRETVVLGRTAECGGALRSTSRVIRDDSLLLAEDLDLRTAALRGLPGVLGTATVIDTVTMLGRPAPATPPLPSGSRFDLDGSAGTVGRALRSESAGSPARSWWAAWAAASSSAYAADR